MKRCPTCKREFEDSITYCLDDGTPLVTEARPASDETPVTPSTGDRDIPTTQLGKPGGQPTVSGSIADLPGLPPYAATRAKRKVWPWVVAGLAILLLFGIVIVAVIAIPKMINRPDPAVATESPSSSADTRTPSEPSSATGAPTDENVVLSQLTELEKQWTVANLEANKATLDQILADDYRGGNPSHNKQQYLDGIRPDSTVKSWEFQDLHLGLEGDRATLDGYLRQETTRGTEVYSFTDEFVWRDGRWQATASRTTRVR
ncbi:MAG TPA: DUF4440 domain-containing protein [Pyrinomonadaceae bacterium]|nr:DUF4440 domain-containing protein [Pyrinomonadaceae bacterium]